MNQHSVVQQPEAAVGQTRLLLLGMICLNQSLSMTSLIDYYII